jgi:FixJ family two-component response regulator
LLAVCTALEKNRQTRAAREAIDVIRCRLATLTPRECEVLALVVTGYLNKQIAVVLGTVEKTIKAHRARMMAKMQAGSLAELVRLAGQVGIGGNNTR